MPYTTLKSKIENLKVGQILPTSIILNQNNNGFIDKDEFETLARNNVEPEDIILKFKNYKIQSCDAYRFSSGDKFWFKRPDYIIFSVSVNSKKFTIQEFDVQLYFNWLKKKQIESTNKQFKMLTPGEIGYVPNDYVHGFETVENMIHRQNGDVSLRKNECKLFEGDVVMILQTHEFENVRFIKFLYQDNMYWTQTIFYSHTWCQTNDNDNHLL
jgi:hypothetical protein